MDQLLEHRYSGTCSCGSVINGPYREVAALQVSVLSVRAIGAREAGCFREVAASNH